jgi:hypothetical protein
MRATTNPEIKAMLLAMAERWAKRAEHAEQRSNLPSASPMPNLPQSDDRSGCSDRQGPASFQPIARRSDEAPWLGQAAPE